MQLSAIERMMLVHLLMGAEGDVTTLRVVRETIGRVGLNDDELERLNPRQIGSQLHWNTDADKPVEIEIGKPVCKVIVQRLKQASEQKALSFAQLDLYEKFCQEEPEEA